MNTSKQVNAMIGLLGLLVVILGAYFINEGTRQADATAEIVERDTERGSRIFINNCRGCHGVEGKGPEEGAIGPALNSAAFLILGEDNEFGVDATTQGVADGIRAFLGNTITCGRTGTFMPAWSQSFGGPLSDTQVLQVVTLLTTPGAWEIEHELGTEHDEETGDTAEDIIVTDPSTLSVTASNCGQYTSAAAAPFRTRDPFDTSGGGDATPAPTEAPTAVGTAPAGATQVNAVLGEWFVTVDPDAVAAGSLAFATTNEGAVAHELAVIRTDLAPDALPETAGSVDESQVEVVARLEQFAGGGASAVLPVELDAGAYALVCNIPGHYGLGMRTGFTVQ